MPNVTKGDRMAGLLAYLAGPGRFNDHVNPRVVGGDPTLMAWYKESSLDRGGAFAVARHLERPRRAFGHDTVPEGSVWHCSLSLTPEETQERQLTDERWQAIARDFAREMGFTRAETPCRWVAIRHGSSVGGNDHIHIVATRVADNGEISDVQGDYKRTQRIANALEHEHELTVLETRETDLGSRGYSPAAKARAERTGAPALDSTVLELKVRACAKSSSDEADFVRRLRDEGVSVRPSFDRDRTGGITGYSVALPPEEGENEVRYGGGTLGKDLSLPRLRKRYVWHGTPESISEWNKERRTQRRQRKAAPIAERTEDGRRALEDIVRRCAKGSADEAEFVNRLREEGVIVNPRHAPRRKDVVTGYSVSLRPAEGEKEVTYGGGELAQNLRLSRLRADSGWTDTPESARAAVEAWNQERRVPPRPQRRAAPSAARTADDSAALEDIVRRCAEAAVDEAEFVRRLGDEGVITRARFAPNRTDVVTGYSVALSPAEGVEGVRYPGGKLAKDLTLTRLRADFGWTATGESAGAAVEEWKASQRRRMPLPNPEAGEPTPEEWAQATADVATLRERARDIPVGDRSAGANLAHTCAGLLSAWSVGSEETPGPLAAAATACARSAQLPAHLMQPEPEGWPSTRRAARLLASFGSRHTPAHAMLLREIANLIKALHDAHEAMGHAQRRSEIAAAVRTRLATVSATLPPADALAAGVAVTDREAAAAAQLARRGQAPPTGPSRQPEPAPERSGGPSIDDTGDKTIER